MRHLFSWCIVWLTATITDAFSVSSLGQLPSFSSALGGSFAGSGATSVASVVAPAWASVTRASRRASAAVLMAADLPRIVQGGMGVQVSNWKLARAVAGGRLHHLSTAMDVVLPRADERRPGRAVLEGARHLPDQAMAQRCIDKFYIEGGKAKDKPYKPLGMWKIEGTNQQLQETTVLSNYAEVRRAPAPPSARAPVPRRLAALRAPRPRAALRRARARPLRSGSRSTMTTARRSRRRVVGINCLTKIQMPTIHSLYGAMLVGCDYVIMGAGIPMQARPPPRPAPSPLRLRASPAPPRPFPSPRLPAPPAPTAAAARPRRCR